jgi:hypothetical protein
MLYVRKLQLLTCTQIACDTLMLSSSCAMLNWLAYIIESPTMPHKSFWTYKSISFAKMRTGTLAYWTQLDGSSLVCNIKFSKLSM